MSPDERASHLTCNVTCDAPGLSLLILARIAPHTPTVRRMAQPVRLIERLPLPTVPPNLKIDHEIGRGSYGTIHVGELDGKPVAVKMLHKLLEDSMYGDSFVRNFVRECEILKAINHPNVISE